MASWDLMSYVSEALSRRITAAAKHEHNVETPSYYDSLTNHFRSHNDSERIRKDLLEQIERNYVVDVDICDALVSVVFNPRDMHDVQDLREEIKKICCEAVKARNALTDEIHQLQMSSDEIKVSSELYDVLNILQAVGKQTGNKFDSTVSSSSASEHNEFWKKSCFLNVKLLDNLRVKWPSGLSLYIEQFFDAWFIDNCIAQMTHCKKFLGGMLTLKAYSHAFGVPRGSEVWKSGISSQCDDGRTMYIGSVELFDEHPAAATSFAESYVEEPGNLLCVTLVCRKAFVAHCLTTTLVSFDSCKVSLTAIKNWRAAENKKKSMAILGFQLFLGFGKNISDLDDSVISEKNSAHPKVFDNSYLMNEAHQTIEKNTRFGDFALKDVRRNNSADAFHLLLNHRDRNLETHIQNCFSSIQETCAVMSFFSHANTVVVSGVSGLQFSQDDSLECTLTVHRGSPSYNYVFAEGSQCTLNFFFEDGQGEYVDILDSYPSWINNPDNKAVCFEYESKQYVTTASLKKKGLQFIFTTLRSSLVGDRLLIIGQLSGIVSGSILMKGLNTFHLSHFSYRCIQPFFLTTVHKLYGTVGLVAWGCHVCTLEPPMVSFHCSAESSDIVMSEENGGLKCTLTFLTQCSSPVFANKTFKDIISFLPISASAVSSLPSSNVAFRLKCRFIEKIQRTLNKDVVCVMSVLEADLVSGGSMALRLVRENETVVPV